jgi:excisionase family DNA binding protein
MFYDRNCKHGRFEMAYLTVTEIAQVLGVSGQTVRTWVKDSVLRGIQLKSCGKILIDEKELKRALRDGRIE